MSKELDRLFPEGKTYIILPNRKIYIFDEIYMTPGNDAKPEMLITQRDLHDEGCDLYESSDLVDTYRISGYRCALRFAANKLVAVDNLNIYSKNAKKILSFIDRKEIH